MTELRRRRVGIDVGGTKCLGVVVDDRGTVTEFARVPTPRSPEGLIDTLATMVEGAGETESVGIGVPGLVHLDGVIKASPNLFDVRDLAVKSLLSERLGREVHVDNDATCAAIAEWQSGAARGQTDVVVVTLGTGIGGGVIANGSVVRGINGFGGEIGHMVVDPNGPECPCGLRGCWERFASGSALAAQARQAVTEGRGEAILALAGDIDSVRGEHVESAARAGNVEAQRIIDDFCRWVALGLANLANVLDPALFVIGGGLARTGDSYISGIRGWFARMLYAPTLRPHPPIELAHHGELAGAIGAAYLPALGSDVGH